SSWLNADGLNPLRVGFRIMRNVMGGGDVAANRLDVAQLERRRAEIEASLRLQISNVLSDLESAERRRDLARTKAATHAAQLKLLAVGYRLGDGSTEAFLAQWQIGEDLRGAVSQAEYDVKREFRHICALAHQSN